MVFDLVVERAPFISNMESLEEAISSFLHVTFVADMEYPLGSGILATFLQRFVARLDHYGLQAKTTKKDMVQKSDKASGGKQFEKAIDAMSRRCFMLHSYGGGD